MSSDRVGQWIEALASADPHLRDAGAFTEIAAAVGEDRVGTPERTRLAEAMLAQLEHERVQARTFAPLILAVLTEAGDWQPEWASAVTRWYLGETDLRGHDNTVGWLHAIAHGADFFGAATQFGRMPGQQVHDILGRRLVTPTEYLWRDQEDVRVAHALALATLQSPASITWLQGIQDALESVQGPPPIWAANTLHTLNSLAIGLRHQIRVGDRWEQVESPEVREHLEAVVAVTQPWFWKPLSPR
ncbi:DUF2785 domain-containing protein [Dermacoccaceae bacterium W4C1]